MKQEAVNESLKLIMQAKQLISQYLIDIDLWGSSKLDSALVLLQEAVDKLSV